MTNSKEQQQQQIKSSDVKELSATGSRVELNVRTPEENENAVTELITQALQLYKPNETMLCFNGGKDCTVLLHLVTKFYNSKPLQHLRVPVLYIAPEDSFDEVEYFVVECSRMYRVEMTRIEGNIKEALIEYCKQNPQIKAVFMGSRRTDPGCADLLPMQSTDSGWPPLMRINPLLDWSYHDIWRYLICNKVPYCCLYDCGYTSLGGRKNTHRNPHLKVVDPKCGPLDIRYMPAYMLKDESTERAGRYVANDGNQMLAN